MEWVEPTYYVNLSNKMHIISKKKGRNVWIIRICKLNILIKFKERVWVIVKNNNVENLIRRIKKKNGFDYLEQRGSRQSIKF